MPSIYKRGKTWCVSYYLGGKQVRRAVSTDKRIAERVLADAVQKRDLQKFRIANPNVSWEEFVKQYLSYSKTNKRAGSVKMDIGTIKKFVNLFNPVKVSNLNTVLLEEYKSKRMEKGVLPSTVNREIGTLKNMIKKAYEWGYLPENFSTQIKKIKDGLRNSSKIRFYQKKEIDKLLSIASPFIKKIILLGLNTGFRLGEMVNLTWNDIDFKKKTAIIQSKENWIPKDGDLREVPLKNNFIHTLRKWNKKLESNYVIGRQTSVARVSSLFRKYTKLAGLEGASAHTLRHTYASHMAMAGVDLYTISKLLGHSDTKTTQIYAHLLPDTLRKAVQMLPF